MKSYALFIGIPLALFIQHVYGVTAENFESKKRMLSVGIIMIFLLLAFVAWKNQWFSSAVCVELAIISIGAVMVSFFIHKSNQKLELDNFQFHERIMSYAGILFGIFCCIFPWTRYYNEMIFGVCNAKEVLFSRIMYSILGCAYVFYNRLFICMLYQQFGSKR